MPAEIAHERLGAAVYELSTEGDGTLTTIYSPAQVYAFLLGLAHNGIYAFTAIVMIQTFSEQHDCAHS